MDTTTPSETVKAISSSPSDNPSLPRVYAAMVNVIATTDVK
jgi:hypothetical protein